MTNCHADIMHFFSQITRQTEPPHAFLWPQTMKSGGNYDQLNVFFCNFAADKISINVKPTLGGA